MLGIFGSKQNKRIENILDKIDKLSLSEDTHLIEHDYKIIMDLDNLGSLFDSEASFYGYDLKMIQSITCNSALAMPEKRFIHLYVLFSLKLSINYLDPAIIRDVKSVIHTLNYNSPTLNRIEVQLIQHAELNKYNSLEYQKSRLLEDLKLLIGEADYFEELVRILNIFLLDLDKIISNIVYHNIIMETFIFKAKNSDWLQTICKHLVELLVYIDPNINPPTLTENKEFLKTYINANREVDRDINEELTKTKEELNLGNRSHITDEYKVITDRAELKHLNF